MSDREYYLSRAKTEREMAAKAERANVADIHTELAVQYEALAERADLRPMLRIVMPESSPTGSFIRPRPTTDEGVSAARLLSSDQAQ